MTADDWQKQFAVFVNEWPLYSPFEIELPMPANNAPEPPRTILRECGTCETTSTWTRRHPSVSTSDQPYAVGVGSIVAYHCTHCLKRELRLWFANIDHRIKVSENTYGQVTRVTLRKLGQWPAQNIEPSRELAKGLPTATLELFKKGLTSLSHGYGIGALAYFRRVVSVSRFQWKVRQANRPCRGDRH